MTNPQARTVAAIKVRQWLPDWSDVEIDPSHHRREPPRGFYMFTLNARELKMLSGIQRRNRTPQKEVDLGIQRRHDEGRSLEIAEFVRHGYPWSEMSKAKRESGKFDDLKKPGWLPTALVVNILAKDDKRLGVSVASEDLITVSDSDDGLARIQLPASMSSKRWQPRAAFPMEVIDGQHRLWAFEGQDFGAEFDLPVVAFYGLDISWQAYLFWTINIKPKKINASLAFDLYPLLRSEDWLEKFEGHSVYRETRAQELVERLWASPSSPWYQRINMLGEPGTKLLSQAAWIRALTASYVRTFDARKRGVGGLFGAPLGEDDLVLPWSRAQQAAFLIYVWREMKRAVWKCGAEWLVAVRDSNPGNDFMGEDTAFYGTLSLLSQDQGVRTLLHVTNDLFWARHEELNLYGWEADIQEQDDEEVIVRHLKSLAKQPVAEFIADACESLALFDWRSANAPGLTDDERQGKLVFRGSGGYREFRLRLLAHVAGYKGAAGEAADDVLARIA